jgi:hypothetical protein
VSSDPSLGARSEIFGRPCWVLKKWKNVSVSEYGGDIEGTDMKEAKLIIGLLVVVIKKVVGHLGHAHGKRS